MTRRESIGLAVLLVAGVMAAAAAAQERDRSQPPANGPAQALRCTDLSAAEQQPPAQQPPKGPPGPYRPFGQPPWARPGPGGPPGPPGATPGRHWPGGPFPPILFELAEKSPEEQERFLQSSPKFRHLPPEAQQALRERLKRISAMNPEQRQRLREHFEIFHRLPPEARDRIRSEIFPAWIRLGPERRRALLEEFRALRRMTPAERDKRFGQEEFARQFSPEEQQLLRQLISLRPTEPEKKPEPRP